MGEMQFYCLLCGIWIFVALFVFGLLMTRSAPYGRYSRRGWGPLVSNRWAWLLMEAPASIGMAFWFWIGRRDWISFSFLLIWEIHYLYRAFVYPFRIRSGKMPLSVPALAFVFNWVNVYLNGRYRFTLSPLPLDWVRDPRFWIGIGIFACGIAINRKSDALLIRLGKLHPGRYTTPQDGLFRWVSCPNYFGEMLEWAGWAIATWSPGGALFFLWTLANLLPRARSHHLFYRAIPGYPQERKALIPFLW